MDHRQSPSELSDPAGSVIRQALGGCRQRQVCYLEGNGAVTNSHKTQALKAEPKSQSAFGFGL